MYSASCAAVAGTITRGTPTSSAARTISATYESAPAGVSGVPNSCLATIVESTSAAWIHSSRAGSLAAYERPVTGSVPLTRSWILRTRAAARSADAFSAKLTVTTYAEVAASLPTGSSRQPLCWSTPAMASGCSAWIISARNPATGADMSAAVCQVTLSGPKNPSSARSCGTLVAYAAADLLTSPAASECTVSVIPAKLREPGPLLAVRAALINPSEGLRCAGRWRGWPPSQRPDGHCHAGERGNRRHNDATVRPGHERRGGVAEQGCAGRSADVMRDRSRGTDRPSCGGRCRRPGRAELAQVTGVRGCRDAPDHGDAEHASKVPGRVV